MRPTHPELLDWLADEFVRQGWSLKRMHRLIMTSTVYRQSSVAVGQVSNLPGCWPASHSKPGESKADTAATTSPTDPRRIDSENSLYWHFPLRRLEAEVLRDRMLVAARPPRPHAVRAGGSGRREFRRPGGGQRR